jgi:hypothetical protein
MTEATNVAWSELGNSGDVRIVMATSRTLWFGSQILKTFNVPAGNQEIVLAAFEDRGWPRCIDNPIPPLDGIDAKRRLHNTLKRLNRSHKRPLIRFAGSGNGQGVRWERIIAAHQSAPRSATERM